MDEPKFQCHAENVLLREFKITSGNQVREEARTSSTGQKLKLEPIGLDEENNLASKVETQVRNRLNNYHLIDRLGFVLMSERKQDLKIDR